MASRGDSVVAVPVREQSEIFENRRKKRRSRINSVHAEVRAILQGDSKTIQVKLGNNIRKSN